MPSVITDLCLREGSCKLICPVDCIVPGNPSDLYPKYYIDPVACIDCGACIPECPNGAIFPDMEVPSAYIAKGTEILSKPFGSEGFLETYDGINYDGEPVHLQATRQLREGEVVDLSSAIADNESYFNEGPGYYD